MQFNRRRNKRLDLQVLHRLDKCSDQLKFEVLTQLSYKEKDTQALPPQAFRHLLSLQRHFLLTLLHMQKTKAARITRMTTTYKSAKDKVQQLKQIKDKKEEKWKSLSQQLQDLEKEAEEGLLRQRDKKEVFKCSHCLPQRVIFHSAKEVNGHLNKMHRQKEVSREVRNSGQQCDQDLDNWLAKEELRNIENKNMVVQIERLRQQQLDDAQRLLQDSKEQREQQQVFQGEVLWELQQVRKDEQSRRALRECREAIDRIARDNRKVQLHLESSFQADTQINTSSTLRKPDERDPPQEKQKEIQRELKRETRRDDRKEVKKEEKKEEEKEELKLPTSKKTSRSSFKHFSPARPPIQELTHHIGPLESEGESPTQSNHTPAPPLLPRKKEFLHSEEQKFLVYVQEKQYSNKGTPQQVADIRQQLEETIERQLKSIGDNSELGLQEYLRQVKNK